MQSTPLSILLDGLTDDERHALVTDQRLSTLPAASRWCPIHAPATAKATPFPSC